MGLGGVFLRFLIDNGETAVLYSRRKSQLFEIGHFHEGKVLFVLLIFWHIHDIIYTNFKHGTNRNKRTNYLLRSQNNFCITTTYTDIK